MVAANPLWPGNFAAEHFDRWLARTVPAEDRGRVYGLVCDFLDDYPELVKEGRSWPEVLTLAERRVS